MYETSHDNKGEKVFELTGGYLGNPEDDAKQDEAYEVLLCAVNCIKEVGIVFKNEDDAQLTIALAMSVEKFDMPLDAWRDEVLGPMVIEANQSDQLSSVLFPLQLESLCCQFVTALFPKGTDLTEVTLRGLYAVLLAKCKSLRGQCAPPTNFFALG